MNTTDLVKKLIEAKDAYYNDEPIMTDAEFDALEEELRELDADHYYFSIVGTNIKGSSKIKHTVPMLSCDKAKNITGIMKWVEKVGIYAKQIICLPKIDGLSASIKYDGHNVYITTRGNGKIGQDVSYLRDYLNIPPSISKVCEVRGEIYLPKDTLFDVEGSPLRNVASGLVNRKSDREDCSHLKFVAYQLIPSQGTITEDLHVLKALGFDVVDYVLIENDTLLNKNLESFYKEYIDLLRKAWNYETDGVVLQINDTKKYDEVDSLLTVSHHHHYNIAWKPEAEGGETIHRKIDWDVSRMGKIVPVSVFDPIIIGGREISRATLNNYGNVVVNNLKIGDTIFITLANEVIPFFSHVVKHTGQESDIPDVCPSCGTKLVVEDIHLICKNKDCRDRNIKQLVAWCVGCEMESVSDSTIAKLYDNGFVKDVKDFYILQKHKKELIDIPGFGESKVSNLLDQIEGSKSMNIHQFIDRLGIDLVGEKAAKKLKIFSILDFWSFNDTQYVIGKNLISYRNENKDVVSELLKHLSVCDIKTKDYIGKVCMTGVGPKSRKELMVIIEEKGYQPVDTINKDLSILICEDVDGSSSKISKAKKLGITLMTYEEFFK